VPGRSLVARILLYSTNTWLAYSISERYYGRKHWVWCGCEFCPSAESPTPPSSSPIEIYRRLLSDVRKGDRHSLSVRKNVTGLLRGVSAKRKSGEISDREEHAIKVILRSAQVQDFRPLIYVIPHLLVSDALEEVPVRDRAHPLSEEYILPALRRDAFDVLEF
jgi:hypothetical protein